MGAKYGLVQRVKRFMSKVKVNSRNNAVGRIRLVTAESPMCYSDNEIDNDL